MFCTNKMFAFIFILIIATVAQVKGNGDQSRKRLLLTSYLKSFSQDKQYRLGLSTCKTLLISIIPFPS